MASRALVLGGPGAPLELVERETPTPGAGELLVRVAYAGICHTDQHLLAGAHPAARYPVVPGHEISGVVAAAGAGASVPEGSPVAVLTEVGCGECGACRRGRVGWCEQVAHLGASADGGWQDHMVVPERAARSVPSSVGLLAAALLEPAANGHAASHAAGIGPDDVVVVIGPGTIGLMALGCALLKRPARTLLAGLEGDDQRLELGRRLGADETVSAPADQLVEAIAARVGPAGADVVIQCAPATDATAVALAVAGRGGRVVVEGYAGDGSHIPLSPDELALGERSVIGVCGWTVDDFEAALAAAASGELRLEPLATDRFGLEEHERALALSRAAANGTVKVMFEPAPGA